MVSLHVNRMVTGGYPVDGNEKDREIDENLLP